MSKQALIRVVEKLIKQNHVVENKLRHIALSLMLTLGMRLITTRSFSVPEPGNRQMFHRQCD